MNATGTDSHVLKRFVIPAATLVMILVLLLWGASDADAAYSYAGMKNVTLSPASAVTFYQNSYETQYMTHTVDESQKTFVLKLRINDPGGHIFSSKRDSCRVQLKSSAAYAGRVSVVKKKLSKNVLRIYLRSSGTAKVKLRVTLDGKRFGYITVRFFDLDMPRSLLLAAGSSGTLSVSKLMPRSSSRYTGIIKWTSSDESVARVSGGIVTGLRSGNAIIYAQVGQAKLGCAVSVTSRQKVDAISQAVKIVNEREYRLDPELRMQDEYYDCSSLVWKVLHGSVCDFGSRSWAPTAADQCRYLYSVRKMIGSFTRVNEQNMIYQAGDVYFFTGRSSEFLGIYHVELFRGYDFQGFTAAGRPVVRIRAVKVDIYGAGSNAIVGRP